MTKYFFVLLGLVISISNFSYAQDSASTPSSDAPSELQPQVKAPARISLKANMTRPQNVGAPMSLLTLEREGWVEKDYAKPFGDILSAFIKFTKMPTENEFVDLVKLRKRYDFRDFECQIGVPIKIAARVIKQGKLIESKPIFTTKIVAYSLAGQPKPESFNAIRSKKFVALKSDQEDLASAQKMIMEFKFVKNLEEALQQMTTGQADFLLSSMPMDKQFADKFNFSTRVSLALRQEKFVCFDNPRSKDIIQQINSTIRSFHQSEDFRKALEKNFSAEHIKFIKTYHN